MVNCDQPLTVLSPVVSLKTKLSRLFQFVDDFLHVLINACIKPAQLNTTAVCSAGLASLIALAFVLFCHAIVHTPIPSIKEKIDTS